MSNSFCSHKDATTQRFKIDLYSLFYENNLDKNIEIMNLDKIVMPTKQIQIGVLGMVKNPQVFSFERNKSALYFIQKAGGVVPINGNNKSFCRRCRKLSIK